jgi:hypothetical protein
VFEEGPDFFARKRASEPLHIVFYEHLHGRAVDRTGALNRHVHAAGNRHVRAKKNLFSHFERSEAESRNLSMLPLRKAPKHVSIPPQRETALDMTSS